MSHDQDHRTHGIFHANPKPSLPKSGLASAIFGRNKVPAFVLPLLLFVGLVGVVWYAYPKSADNEIVPVIHTDPMVYKMKPENPGGMDVPHQDSTVFEPFETVVEDKKEQLLPETEKAVERSTLFKNRPTRKPDFKPMLNLDLQLEQSGDAVESLIAREETVPVADLKKRLKNPELLTQEPPSSQESEDMAVVPKQAPVEKPQANVEAPKTVGDVIADLDEKPQAPVAPVAQKNDPAPKPAPVVDKNGWVVQLGAFSKKSSAERAWSNAVKTYGGLLSERHADYESVIKDGRTLYRLRAGYFVHKDAAAKTCDALKAKGGSCIVTK